MEGEAAAAAGAAANGTAPAAEIVGVKVVVRVRKLLAHEVADGCQPCMVVGAEEGCDGSGGQRLVPPPQQVLVHDKAFEFDRAFGPEACQTRVYEETARPLLDKFFDGFNATVLAYGQTGSGKTHTMGNTLALGQEALDSSGAGIIPRVLQDVFARIEAERQVATDRRRGFSLKLSYLEIYMEETRDLLLPASSAGPAPALNIREQGDGIAVAGLSLHEVTSLEAVAELLYRGALARATATTNMNSHSSRSHAVCTLHLESWLEAEAGTASMRRTLSKFNLVDLAGSERAKRTGAEGDRLKEGIQINRGLLALGNVISALTDPTRSSSSGNKGHVPYRDSKITRLLQDSLGGSAVTCMIACVSPADSNADESINTLRYAQRARSIQNLATQHSSQTGTGENGAEVLALRKEVRLLQLQLAQARGGRTAAADGGGGGVGVGEPSAPLVQWLREENGRLRASVQQLEAEARAAAEAAGLNALLLESLRLRLEQVGALAKEAGLEVPAGLLDGHDGSGSVSSSPPVSVGAALLASSVGTGGEDGSPLGAERSEGGDGEEEAEGRALVSGELASLDEEITRKEAAVAQLAKEGQSFGMLKAYFEGHIARLQAEVEALQGQQQARGLQAAGSGGQQGSEARKRERELERKLKELQAKSASYARVLQLKTRAEDEARKLRAEIDQAKKRQGELVRRHREEAKRLCQERRAKDLEAVRLRRNEARMKYEYESKIQSSARQEAVLRRKLEEALALQKQYQETVRRLTEGAKGRAGLDGGHRQQQRVQELRRHVRREMEACRAYLAKRATLRQLLLQRQAQEGGEEEGEGLAASIRMLLKEVQEAETAAAGSSGAGLLARDTAGDVDEQTAVTAAAAALAAAAGEEAPSAVVSSTRRWVHIKTLGEARHVLAYLFEVVLAAAEQPPSPLVASPPLAVAMEASAAKPIVPPPGVTGSSSVQEKPASTKPEAKEEEEEEEDEEEEDDWEESSSSEEEEEEDSDEEYLPDDSPSRPRARAPAKRASNEQEGGGSGGKQKKAKAKQRGSDGSAGGLESEIDALLDDDGDEGLAAAGERALFGGGPPPPVESLEPLEKCTVAQLKAVLKAHGLPTSGRKDALIQRLRGQASSSSSALPAGAPSPAMAAAESAAVGSGKTGQPGATLSDGKAMAPSSGRVPLRDVSNDAGVLKQQQQQQQQQQQAGKAGPGTGVGQGAKPSPLKPWLANGGGGSAGGSEGPKRLASAPSAVEPAME